MIFNFNLIIHLNILDDVCFCSEANGDIFLNVKRSKAILLLALRKSIPVVVIKTPVNNS